MKTRHGLQIKQLLQKKHLSKSRFNPQSQLSIKSPSMKQSRDMKKSQSSNSLHYQSHKKHCDLEIMQSRYRQLKDQYQKIVEEQRKRLEMSKKQHEQIQKYQKAAQRDKKQIQRLRSMIGFVNKTDFGMQTSVEIQKSQKQEKKTFEIKEIKERKSTDSKRDCSRGLNRSRVSAQYQIEEVEWRNGRQPKSITKSRTTYTNYLSMGQQFSSQKKFVKKYQPLSSKLGESIVYGSKSSTDFRKKRAHVQKSSDLFMDQSSHEMISKSRMHSPNSRYKFVPSVQI